MRTLELDAVVDEQGRLVVAAPIPLPPGKVRITVDASVAGDADADDADYRLLAADVWRDSLSDPAEDVYTINDGVPIDPMTGEAGR